MDIPDTGIIMFELGLVCDLMWSDPREGAQGWG
jgi:serine/threonine-protein phosphatase PP1 catalytic subunit